LWNELSRRGRADLVAGWLGSWFLKTTITRWLADGPCADADVDSSGMAASNDALASTATRTLLLIPMDDLR
jgi:hypothetical protein